MYEFDAVAGGDAAASTCSPWGEVANPTCNFTTMYSVQLSRKTARGLTSREAIIVLGNPRGGGALRIIVLLTYFDLPVAGCGGSAVADEAAGCSA